MAVAVGIDAGVQTLKVAVVNDGDLVTWRVARYGDEPIASVVQRTFDEVVAGAGLKEAVGQVVVTGRCRGSVPPKTREVPTALALAKGLAHIDPSGRTVLDVGSQGALAVRCKGGMPLAIVGNDRCAAGTGSYVEALADIFGVPIEGLAEMAARADPSVTVEVVSTCAVYAETEIISLLHGGHRSEDVVRGAFRAFAARMESLLTRAAWEPEIVMAGGLARSTAVVQALEERLGTHIRIPEAPECVAAVGAAILGAETKGGVA